MNKKAITLVCIFILLVSTQLACSFSDLLGNLNLGNLPPDSGEEISEESQIPQNPPMIRETSDQEILPSSSQPN